MAKKHNDGISRELLDELIEQPGAQGDSQQGAFSQRRGRNEADLPSAEEYHGKVEKPTQRMACCQGAVRHPVQRPICTDDLSNDKRLNTQDFLQARRFRRPGHRVTGNRRLHSPGAGWEYVHVAIDDPSRVGFADLRPSETAHSATRALLAALRYFKTLGITCSRVMTDNGACYRSQRFAQLCRRLKLRHIRTRPYTPQTNGKAERFIQSALREWAYARAYDHSNERAEYLPGWLHRYNWHRPHASLKYQPPIHSLNIPLNNVVGLHLELRILKRQWRRGTNRAERTTSASLIVKHNILMAHLFRDLIA